LPYFAESFQCRSILEIGAGLSTGIWSQYSKNTGATVTSIDASKSNIQRYYQNTKYMSDIEENIDFHRGVTISIDDLVEFYKSPTKELSGVPVSDFKSDLDRFCRLEGVTRKRFKKIIELIDDKNFSISDILISDNSLYFPEEYIQIYINQENIKSHGEKIVQNNKTNILDELIDSNDGWDFIWFDSGEASSLIEWKKLNKHINTGGLAAFHDIFAPKSMKNFIIAASIVDHPDWNVLCLDNRTKQGLMIAQKSK
jgi:predicted O-methyltransferase YrrM